MRKILLALCFNLLLCPLALAQETTPAGNLPDVESKFETPIFPVKGFYIDNGYAFGILLHPDDRSVIKDSLWIDGRVGYQVNKNVGIHLGGSFFPSSIRTSGSSNATYLSIGPGMKLIQPFSKHWAGVLNLMAGYGRFSFSTSSISTHSHGGLALGMDGGVIYKINPWLGLTPYLGLNTISGRVNGQGATSYWLVSGVMVNFIF